MRPVQWVASPGGSAQVSAVTRCTVASGVRRLPGFLVLSCKKPVDVGLGEAPLPAPHRRPANPGLSRHLRHAQPLGRMHHDPGPRRAYLPLAAIGQDRRQKPAILGREKQANRLCHALCIAETHANLKFQYASIQQLIVVRCQREGFRVIAPFIMVLGYEESQRRSRRWISPGANCTSSRPESRSACVPIEQVSQRTADQRMITA